MKQLWVVALGCILLLACSQSRPSKQDAINQISAMLASTNGLFSISNVEYVNGFQRDQNDYVVQVQYTRTWNKSAHDIVKGLDKDQIQFDTLGALGLLQMKASYGNFEGGDRFEESGQFSFLKTENGWLLQARIASGDIQALSPDQGVAQEALAADKKEADEEHEADQLRLNKLFHSIKDGISSFPFVDDGSATDAKYVDIPVDIILSSDPQANGPRQTLPVGARIVATTHISNNMINVVIITNGIYEEGLLSRDKWESFSPLYFQDYSFNLTLCRTQPKNSLCVAQQ